MAYDNSDVVIDRSRATWSDLWLKEDYWAIWIGLILLLAGTCLVFSNRSELESKYQDYAAILRAESAKPIKTVEYYQAAAAQKALQGQNLAPAKDFINYLKTPARWQSNPLDALFMTQAAADEANRALGAQGRSS